MARHRRAHLAEAEHSNFPYCSHRAFGIEAGEYNDRRIRRLNTLTSIAAAISLAVSFGAAAQSWPQKPVHFLVSLGPSSGADIGARLYADRLAKMWGQPVVVENRPGGDGVI